LVRARKHKRQYGQDAWTQNCQNTANKGQEIDQHWFVHPRLNDKYDSSAREKLRLGNTQPRSGVGSCNLNAWNDEFDPETGFPRSRSCSPELLKSDV
jgi:hypothetical protein